MLGHGIVLRHLGILIFLALAAGCGDKQFNFNSSGSAGANGQPEDGVDGVLVQVMHNLKPTLAVRGVACLMCHADIRSNLVTDFGLGNTWYFGGEGNTLDTTQTPFSNIANAWQSAYNINGSVIIPKAPIIRSIQNALGPAYVSAPLVSVQTLMSTPYENQWVKIHPGAPWVAPDAVNKPMDYRIIPPAGQPKLIEKSLIVIRGPDESEITSLSAGHPFADRGGYFANDPSQVLDCKRRDIVVKGTLLLRNLQLNAAEGCRIYVSGSIFIEGGISYTGPGENQNLQLTSANGIFMGFSRATLETRVINDARGAQLGWSAKTYRERALQAVSEAGRIGDLKDAAGSNPRGSYNYTGLLLNAPMIHSRYLGEINGAVIAEIALFAVGQLHFQFDPVLTKVDLLPLLKKPIVQIE